jgi:hypothetical protein
MSLRPFTHPSIVRFVTVGSAAGLALVLGACSSKAVAQKRAAEKLIRGELSQHGFGPLAPACDTPADDAVVGDHFACRATTTAGKVIIYDGSITSGGVRLVPTNAIPSHFLRTVEATAVGALEDKLGETIGAENFSCGDYVFPYEPNKPFPCVMKNPESGDSFNAEVTVDGLTSDANVHVKLLGARAAS